MGVHNWNHHHSKEDQTLKISKSVFITNFPEGSTAKDLWKVCNDYGTVVDVFIPFKKSKAGKRFAFVCFIKVINLERLVDNLCTIWIGKHHLHANVVRFQRPHKPDAFVPKGTNSGSVKSSFPSVLKEGNKVHVSPVNIEPALVLDDSCIKEYEFSSSLMGKIKDVSAMPNLYTILSEEGFQNIKITYLRGMIIWLSIEGLPIKAWTSNSFRKIASLWGELVEWEDTDSKSLSVKHMCLKTKLDVCINDRWKIIVQGKVFWICAKEMDAWTLTFHDDPYGDSSNKDSQDDGVEDISHDKNANGLRDGIKSKDPFNIYDMLNGQHKKASNLSNEPEFPPGFTPINHEGELIAEESVHDVTEQVQSISNKLKERKLNGGVLNQSSSNTSSQKIAGGSILEAMDELVKVSQTMGYNMEGCAKNIEAIIGSQGETKMENIDAFSIKDLWGILNFDYVVGSSVGFSSDIVCVWDSSKFIQEHVSKSDYFVAIIGTWSPSSTKLLVISVYAPQELREKRDLWNYLRSFIDRWEGETVIMGDFNEVRFEHERFGTLFNRQGANAFNNFICLAGLIDLPLEGYAFTWAHKTASKMSKLGRFLISEGLLTKFPHLSALCLDRHLSDHWPLLMRESCFDFGPTPFRVFHSCFSMEGFDTFMESTWKSMNVDESNGLIRLKKKLQCLKNAIKVVSEFFKNGHIPRGCNFSFIALIPKIQDAKLVKDFWPISLIGIVYKIITKVLANRMYLVLPSIVSEVQSAFVSNRQILDGPFILDELLSWCKNKKKRAMIFKVDFEKAFDSVKWEYLIDSLKAFGFGQKWCKWIHGCLDRAMGSVLVNGSPTSEFQFHKGLKQGDLMSPFLFILVMESLHLSFKRVIDAGLYKGISLNASFMISHLFYADDAVFVGEWSASNIITIANVLKCFYLASGLKINFHKSKLMGVGVNSDVVNRAASMVGCSMFTSPLKYLGVKVGANMSRISSWEDVVNKVSTHLSTWKLKTLSIGGRLTLIKSVLTSIPLYHMSIFKVPLGVLKELEAIRQNFFNGAKSIHGNQGALDSSSTRSRRSPWLDIIKDIHSLKYKGDDNLKSIYPRLYALEEQKSISVAVKLQHPSLVHSFRRLPIGGVEEVQLDSLHSLEVPTRWVKVIPIKVNVLAWRVYLDKIPNRLNLSTRGINIPSILCPICNSFVESTSHVFFSCSLARHLRSKISRWWEINDTIINSYGDWLNWLINIRLPTHQKIFLEEERVRVLVGSPRGSMTPSYSPGSSTTPIYSPGASTNLSYSLGPSTPPSYSPGPSRNVECANCKLLIGKLQVLEATLEMYMHLEKHTIDSTTLLHELYNDTGKISL
ncbi:RNA-directed DNA polymerase, eukaryota [Tanacetum coccineum]